VAFDTAETAAVLAGLGGAPPSDDQLARVQSATDGWPVAVYLTWRAHRAGHDLDDYLDSEVFTDVDADLLDLLQRTSVATALSGPLCAALLEDPAAIDLLREAARSTPLVTVLQGEDPWFRVHPLLRERLLADLVERDPALVLALHARAAEWYAAKGLADDAVEHALRSERADLVGRVLWEPAIAALLVGRNSRIAAWLARVPMRSPPTRRWRWWRRGRACSAARPRGCSAGARRPRGWGRRHGIRRWTPASRPRCSGCCTPPRCARGTTRPPTSRCGATARCPRPIRRGLSR
jgi:ATP/maltotriose-dependent transcriptional regulator MalT